MISYGQRLLNERDLYAERNTILHLLCHELLEKYRAACPDDPFVHEAWKRLANVPQRMRTDNPMRLGY